MQIDFWQKWISLSILSESPFVPLKIFPTNFNRT